MRSALPIVARQADSSRWLLEVFDVGSTGSAPAAPTRHAVWLSRDDGLWRWWCCCGHGSELRSDLVSVLTLARMHFDAFGDSVASPVEHPVSNWRRSMGEAAQDDVAVAELASRLL